MDKLRQTVKFMRQNGLLKLKTADFDIELHPAAIAMPAKRTKQNATADEKTIPEYSDMDVLLWSAPGLQPTDEEKG